MARFFSGFEFLRTLNIESLAGIIRYLRDNVLTSFISNVHMLYVMVVRFALHLLSGGAQLPKGHRQQVPFGSLL